MKITVSAIVVLLLVAACNRGSDKYFMGKKSKLLGFGSADYILAEKKGDSLQIWYITDDINAGYFERYKTETIPFRPATKTQ